ncbi:MAG: hypothetical protein QG625_1938 [Cyanobacteriota bacterium erpe_2018_sw_39hr_WHONDRS-SW48-000098_B_bin.30]|nr:hypothetical protein [Cyanobacteriota bacterium erpe_2018_sw_39hr_WHONDRS-SW48-000098_B_bin.30]
MTIKAATPPPKRSFAANAGTLGLLAPHLKSGRCQVKYYRIQVVPVPMARVKAAPLPDHHKYAIILNKLSQILTLIVQLSYPLLLRPWSKNKPKTAAKTI